jgi:hypothetical protein
MNAAATENLRSGGTLERDVRWHNKDNCKSQSQSQIKTDNQPVLVSGAYLGPATNFSFSLSFSFRQLMCGIL